MKQQNLKKNKKNNTHGLQFLEQNTGVYIVIMVTRHYKPLNHLYTPLLRTTL